MAQPPAPKARVRMRRYATPGRNTIPSGLISTSCGFTGSARMRRAASGNGSMAIPSKPRANCGAGAAGASATGAMAVVSAAAVMSSSSLDPGVVPVDFARAVRGRQVFQVPRHPAERRGRDDVLALHRARRAVGLGDAHRGRLRLLGELHQRLDDVVADVRRALPAHGLGQNLALANAEAVVDGVPYAEGRLGDVAGVHGNGASSHFSRSARAASRRALRVASMRPSAYGVDSGQISVSHAGPSGNASESSTPHRMPATPVTNLSLIHISEPRD